MWKWAQDIPSRGGSVFKFKARIKVILAGEKVAATRKVGENRDVWQIAKLIHGDKASRISKEKLLHYNGINVKWVKM